MELITDAFAPYAPREAQFHMPVEEWVERFAPVKPLFIHHARTREIMERLVAELGCDPDDTYLDVPRLRGVTSDGYLTVGCRLRPSPAPRHLVRGADVADQLVAPHCTTSSARRACRSSTSTSIGRSATAPPSSTTTSGMRSGARTRRSTCRPTRAASPSPRSRSTSTTSRATSRERGGHRSRSRARNCTRRCRTRRDWPASASTSARSTGPMCSRAGARRTATRRRPVRRCATS